MEINKELAQKVKNIVSKGLSKGLGNPIPGEMCVEAAVNYACGLPHGDNPSCVGAAVRSFKISLNDKNWTSKEARATGMMKIAIAQLGSNIIDQIEFARIITFKTITQLLPVYFTDLKFIEEAEICKKFKSLSEAIVDLNFMKEKFKDIYSKAHDTDASISYTAAATYAYAAAAAADSYDVNAADDYVNDKYLLISADICLQTLIELKSPGCEFLNILN